MVTFRTNLSSRSCTSNRQIRRSYDWPRVWSPGSDTVCEKVRAFYDYVGNELTYTYNAESWGAQAALGPMGADCTEYTSLLMALSRAQGIPARYFEGLRYRGDRDPSTDARIEHAWPDVYMPGVGWVGMDPTLGRSPLTRDTLLCALHPRSHHRHDGARILRP